MDVTDVTDISFTKQNCQCIALKSFFVFCSNSEWESDSSFDFDEDSEPVTSLPRFCMAMYKDQNNKKNRFPFEICDVDKRLLYSYYLEETPEEEHVHEESPLWIKCKYYHFPFPIAHIIIRGTAGRLREYYTFHK